MTIFLAIIAFLVAFFTLDGIVLNGQKRVFSVLLLLLILFLLFLVIRFDKLIKTGWCKSLTVGLFCFFRPGFLGAGLLGSGSLGLYL